MLETILSFGASASRPPKRSPRSATSRPRLPLDGGARGTDAAGARTANAAGAARRGPRQPPGGAGLGDRRGRTGDRSAAGRRDVAVLAAGGSSRGGERDGGSGARHPGRRSRRPLVDASGRGPGRDRLLAGRGRGRSAGIRRATSRCRGDRRPAGRSRRPVQSRPHAVDPWRWGGRPGDDRPGGEAVRRGRRCPWHRSSRVGEEHSRSGRWRAATRGRRDRRSSPSSGS